MNAINSSFPLDLLSEGSKRILISPTIVGRKEQLIINAFSNKNVTISEVSCVVGPTVVRFELIPDREYKQKKIRSCEYKLNECGPIRLITPVPRNETDSPYKFPYEDYEIIGDAAEIDRIINTSGFININTMDIESTLSKESANYVTVGAADDEGCIANALKVAIGKLPIEIGNVSKLLFNLWMPKNMSTPMTEINR